ncbi:cupin domain-containing protein [Actinomadura fibrosa]|uniref:Cupin domain-containing protein n=1 Tax=Actinomadura fibrosa TaxID=111802 RepID=A0ABW2XLT5_9ACTN|nr:cupin domain-containing protein [Actinomadura fibrosa]
MDKDDQKRQANFATREDLPPGHDRGAEGVYAKVLIDSKTTSAKGLAFGHISFGAGSCVPAHTRQVEEFIYVIEGTATILSCEKEFVLHPGDAIYIPAGTEHQHVNREASQTLHQLYIFSPPGPEQGVREWPLADDGPQ